MSTDIVSKETTELAPMDAAQAQAFMQEFDSQAREEEAQGFSGFPRLSVINKADFKNPVSGELNLVTDADGNPLGAGTFHINGTDLFTKEVKFRPLFKRYQYVKYDDDYKMIGRTVFFSTFRRAEIPDSFGTSRLGRPSGDDFYSLSEKDQDAWKRSTPVHMHVFGLVYMEGGPEEGTLVDFRLGGVKFKDMADFFDIIGYEHGIGASTIKLTLKQEESGSNIYFSLVPSVEKDKDGKPIAEGLQPYEIEAAKCVQEYISEQNDSIMDKHMSIRKKNLEDVSSSGVIDAIFNDAVDITEAVDAEASGEEAELEAEDDDLNDEIPF